MSNREKQAPLRAHILPRHASHAAAHASHPAIETLEAVIAADPFDQLVADDLVLAIVFQSEFVLEVECIAAKAMLIDASCLLIGKRSSKRIAMGWS